MEADSAVIDWRATLVRREVLVPGAIVLLALLLRLVGIANIHQPYWDEVTYVGDAKAYLGRGPAELRPTHPDPEIAESSWMHPPLGKWSIAAGELVFGDTDLGNRIAAVLAGTVGVLLLYVLALELWASIPMAATAAALLALDGLHIVQSRIAMLDVFLSTYLLAGGVALVRARRGRTSILWAGAWLGAAFAVKWAAAPYVLLAAAAWFVWSRRDWRQTALAFLAVPAAVYAASYVSFFLQNGADIAGFLRLQKAMLTFGRTFENASPYRSSPWTWPLLRRPVEYAHKRFLEGGVRIVGGKIRVVRVLAIGNPATWWTFLAAGPAVAVRLARRRRWQDAVIVAGYLAGWVPWMFTARTKFLYYVLPSVPFLCLGLTAAIWMLGPRLCRLAAGSLVAAAAVVALLYFPVWTAMPLSLPTYLRLAHLPGVRDSVIGSGFDE